MKKLLFGVIFFVAVNGTSFAVLPPFWENVHELKVILDDQQLGNFFESGEVIQEIRKIDNGWMIITNRGQVQVIVNYRPQRHPGPAQFDLQYKKLD